MNAAQSLGMGHEIGIIAVGAQASIVGTEINPLDNLDALDNISFIMNRGNIIKNLNWKN
jgi:imidazolonepropionase-like amidohydrolase